jgi:hypothetical protein
VTYPLSETIAGDINYNDSTGNATLTVTQ